MRRRLTVVLLFFVVGIVLVLGVPLAVAARARAEQSLRDDRLADAAWYSGAAERALVDADYEVIASQLRRYDRLYGIALYLTDGSGRVVAGSRDHPAELGPDGVATSVLATALAGQAVQSTGSVWPWSSEPLVSVVPVGADERVVGAVVSVSPTGPARSATLRAWVALVGLAALAVLLALGAVHRLTGWIIRPIDRLDRRITEAGEAARRGRIVPETFDSAGPPELVGVAETFDRVAVRLAVLIAAQRSFVADAGHQLRNPLTALRIRLHTLVPRIGGAVLDDLGSAMHEVDRLVDVVDGLLALARSGQPPADAESCPVDEALARRLDAWRPLAEAGQVSLDRHGAAGARAWAEPDLLDGVLDPLIDNAVRFAPAGSAVDLTVEALAAQVVLRVRDRGPGLSGEDRVRACERFWRGSGQDTASGTGLGLPIAAALVARNGGTLTLRDPALGPGLEVEIRLPADVAEGRAR